MKLQLTTTTSMRKEIPHSITVKIPLNTIDDLVKKVSNEETTDDNQKLDELKKVIVDTNNRCDEN